MVSRRRAARGQKEDDRGSSRLDVWWLPQNHQKTRSPGHPGGKQGAPWHGSPLYLMCRPRFSPECVQTALHSGAGGRSREAPPAPPSRAAPSRPSRCNAPPTGETTRGSIGRGETPRPPSSRRACFALARRGTAHGGETSRWVGSSGAHVVRKARRRGWMADQGDCFAVQHGRRRRRRSLGGCRRPPGRTGMREKTAPHRGAQARHSSRGHRTTRPRQGRCDVRCQRLRRRAGRTRWNSTCASSTPTAAQADAPLCHVS
ncbi:unnamed protein product [Prorocentrum cordatum]|uniref:Uncharacterized protein n=1 Tax=Prorocentrum cordatum TaxID=2364126 RepID=A0ABN9U016_9DINO|nr:unnamed protein product [Polarella glacialis]